MKKKKRHTCILTIAGSDSSAGAGIQADIKTISALGGYGVSVITAVTAQNTKTVAGIHEIPAEFVKLQIETIFSDIKIHAVKTGMLRSAKIIETVVQMLKTYKVSNVVVDPVMVSKSGSELLNTDAINILKTQLIPLATIVTPNIPEASILAGIQIKKKHDVEKAGRIILSLGPKAVLIKGGHLKGVKCIDYLFIKEKNKKITVTPLENRRIKTKNTHGTGCSLASAIAVYLAKGYDIRKAVKLATDYIYMTIYWGASYKIGKGNGPLHHFFKLWH